MNQKAVEVAPWPGGIVDLGGTALYRRNGLTGATTSALHPNVGIEQSLRANTVVLRAGIDDMGWRPAPQPLRAL